MGDGVSDKIGPGDLVCLICPSPCCGSSVGVGRIFRVHELRNGNGTCEYCHHRSISKHAVDVMEYGAQLNRLIKINPLVEQSSATTDKEIPCLT